jgi:hypothetical protein
MKVAAAEIAAAPAMINIKKLVALLFLARKIPNAISGVGEINQGASTTYVSQVVDTASGCFIKSLVIF